MDTTTQRLQAVFQRVFGDDSIELTRETTALDIDGWDSLNHINLIIGIEKEFRIKFSTADISRMKEDGKTVGDLIDVISTKAK